MFLSNEELMKIASRIIKENFPNKDGISVHINKDYEVIIGINIDDAEYIADLLSCDSNLKEIAKAIEKEMMEICEDDRPVIIQRKGSLYSYSQRDLDRLTRCC